MKFFLGSHMPNWLGHEGPPLFVSHRRLFKRKTFPRARRSWALDSGGFSELSLYSRWQTSPKAYSKYVERYASEIGRMDWASIQDWMCEPFMLEKTGLSVEGHQQKTIESYLELSSLAPGIQWAPVLQGWQPRDYLDHVDQYVRAGIDLWKEPVVGVGSVCRRQGTAEGVGVFRSLCETGLRLHGFGLKKSALKFLWSDLESADSMAWSFAARRRRLQLPGCKHKTCSSCLLWAERWYDEVVQRGGRQMELFA